jgi:hypothetical protein
VASTAEGKASLSTGRAAAVNLNKWFTLRLDR